MSDENIEEKSVFDEAQVSEELPTEQISPDEAEETEEAKEFNPTISNESPKAKLERMGEKKEADGRTLTIASIGFTKPRTREADGSPVPPKKTQDGTKEFYPGKLKIKFEEDNLVEYLPNFHYFVSDEGKLNTQAKINRSGNNAVAKLFKLAIEKIAKPMDEVSDQDFYTFLVGKKVLIKTAKGEFNKKQWFRNDIVEFVE